MIKILRRQDERERHALALAADIESLVPPPAKFRIVKNVYTKDGCAEWLCLPRDLDTIPPADADAADSSEDGQGELVRLDELEVSHEELAVSLPTIRGPEESTGIIGLERDTNVNSLVDSVHHTALAQLVVVKMHDQIATLRNESNILMLLHDKIGSKAFIGGCMIHEMISYSAPTSWLSLCPVFGKTLDAFAETCLEANRIPAYFVWHVFLGLVSGLEFVHDAGIAHGDVSGANVRLVCPSLGRQRYNDWPGVVLTGFHAATDEVERKIGEDVVNMAKIISDDMIRGWSDAALLMPIVDVGAPTSDPLVQLAAVLQNSINASSEGRIANLDDLRTGGWHDVAATERGKGPDSCPEWLKSAAHDGLVTNEELEKATRPPLVLKFGPNSDQFTRWDRARREPVALQKRQTRHRRTERSGLLVIKFELRRKKFADLVDGD